MNPPVGILDVVRRVFPDASNDEASYLVWSRTGFPAFFPRGVGPTLGQALEHQLRNFKAALNRAKAAHRSLCEFCNRFATAGSTTCRRCEMALSGDEA